MSDQDKIEEIENVPMLERVTSWWDRKIDCMSIRKFLNPFYNPFGERIEFEGKSMDYFGYCAHKLTKWKQENIFCYQLLPRGGFVMLSTLLAFKLGRGIIPKLILAAATYNQVGFIVTPECVNPYYATYIQDYNFPSFNFRANSAVSLKENLRYYANLGIDKSYETISDTWNSSKSSDQNVAVENNEENSSSNESEQKA